MTIVRTMVRTSVAIAALAGIAIIGYLFFRGGRVPQGSTTQTTPDSTSVLTNSINETLSEIRPRIRELTSSLTRTRPLPGSLTTGTGRTFCRGPNCLGSLQSRGTIIATLGGGPAGVGFTARASRTQTERLGEAFQKNAVLVNQQSIELAGLKQAEQDLVTLREGL